MLLHHTDSTHQQDTSCTVMVKRNVLISQDPAWYLSFKHIYIHGTHIAHKYFPYRHVRQHILVHINLENSFLTIGVLHYGWYKKIYYVDVDNYYWHLW